MVNDDFDWMWTLSGCVIDVWLIWDIIFMIFYIWELVH